MEEERRLEELLEKMIDTQFKLRGLNNEQLFSAMRKIKRHLFVNPDQVPVAYTDRPLPVGEGQTISQPYMVALMTDLLAPQLDEKILEVGTGSGWQAAILSVLCKEVFTVERIHALAHHAQGMFEKLNLSNIKVKIGDGSQGWAENAPYDGIIVTCASPSVPEPLVKQVKIGGKIVIPVGSRFSQDLIVARKIGPGNVRQENYGGCVFVPLVGEHGFKS